MHGGVGYGPQVDPEAKLVGGEILGQGHVGPATFVRVEVTGQFIPHVFATDALVVHPVGHAVHRNFNLSYVGVEVAFRVPGTSWRVAGVRASCDGNHLFTHDKVVRELLAHAVRAERLISQGLASNDLVLQLDVFQLVPELGGVRAVYHLAGWG